MISCIKPVPSRFRVCAVGTSSLNAFQSDSFTQHRDTKSIPKVDNAGRPRGLKLNEVDEDNDWETEDSDEEEDDEDFFNDGKKSTGKKPAIRLKSSRPTHFDEQFEKVGNF